MGPEIVAAIIAAVVTPTLGGFVSLMLFFNKKNSDYIENQFKDFDAKVENVVDKIDEIGHEVRDGYVKNEVLAAHIKGEEQWHEMFSRELAEIKSELRQIKDMK